MNTIAAPPDPDSDRRWRQWRSDYEASSRSATQIARVVFGVVFTASAVWVGLQFMR
jgi:hypothetical protein